MYSDKSVGDTMYSKPQCIAISQSVTLGSEVRQPECIVISWSAALGTEACKP